MYTWYNKYTLLRTVIFKFAYRIKCAVEWILNLIKDIRGLVIKNFNFNFYEPSIKQY